MTEDNFRYTVAMCNLNNESVIEESIRSIADQLDRRFELLVVDDGSTDGSLEILRDLEAEYPTIRVIEGDNNNLGEARNHSFREARGEYILESLDPDDKYKQMILDFVCVFEQLSDALDREFYLKGHSINMAPRELLLDYPYRSLGYGEDKDLWRRLFADGKIIWLDHEPFYETLRDEYDRDQLIRNELDKMIVEFRSGVTLSSFLWRSLGQLRAQPRLNTFRLIACVTAFLVALRRGRHEPPTSEFKRMGALKKRIKKESRTLPEIESDFCLMIDRDALSETGREIFYGDVAT